MKRHRKGQAPALLALLLPQLWPGAFAQTPTAAYVNGELSISGVNVTMAEVLAKIAALTGVKIEIPEGAPPDRMSRVKLGPGPARQILARLLSDSDFDYLIQGTDADPEKLQSVLLMRREKKSGKSVAEEAAARRSPYARPAPEPEEPAPQAVNIAVPATQDPLAGGLPDTSLPDAPVAPPAPAAPRETPNPLDFPKTAPLSPPSALTQENINQQLQQMYQQRMQITQQGRTAPPP